MTSLKKLTLIAF